MFPSISLPNVHLPKNRKAKRKESKTDSALLNSHYKCWKVTGVLPWSAFLFVVGYILREIGAFNYDNLKIFISSLVLIYSAP